MGHGHNVNDKDKRLYSFPQFEGLNPPSAVLQTPVVKLH